MKRKKKVVEIAYKYVIDYEHEDHLNELLDELIKKPSFGCRGTVASKGDGCYSYSVELVKGGRVIIP